MSFSPKLWGFLTKKYKISNVEKIRKYDFKKVYIFEETLFSSFEIASVPNWERTKFAGVSRPSCYIQSIQTLIWQVKAKKKRKYSSNIASFKYLKGPKSTISALFLMN